jgi:hypothetical protein
MELFYFHPGMIIFNLSKYKSYFVSRNCKIRSLMHGSISIPIKSQNLHRVRTTVQPEVGPGYLSFSLILRGVASAPLRDLHQLLPALTRTIIVPYKRYKNTHKSDCNIPEHIPDSSENHTTFRVNLAGTDRQNLLGFS